MNIHLISQRSASSESLLRGLNPVGLFNLRLITRNGKACLNPIGCMKNGLRRSRKMSQALSAWSKAETQLKKLFPTNIMGLKTTDSSICGGIVREEIGSIFTNILPTTGLKNGRLKPRNENPRKTATRG